MYQDAIHRIEEAASQGALLIAPEWCSGGIAFYSGKAPFYAWQGWYAEAEQAYQDATHAIEEAVSQGALIIEPEWTVAYYLVRLAALYSRQGRHAEAEQLSQRAMSLREQSPPVPLFGSGIVPPDCSCTSSMPRVDDPFFGSVSELRALLGIDVITP